MIDLCHLIVYVNKQCLINLRNLIVIFTYIIQKLIIELYCYYNKYAHYTVPIINILIFRHTCSLRCEVYIML